MDRITELCLVIFTLSLLITPGSGQLRCTTEQIDLVFVVDSSGSIRDTNPDGWQNDPSRDNWNLMLNFIVGVVDNLDIGLNKTRVGMVMYSGNANSEFYLRDYSDRESLKSRIRMLQHIGGDTNTAAGLREMHLRQFTAQNGDRPDVPNTAVIITDGISTIDVNRTIADAESAKQDDIRIISFGISVNISEAELRGISSDGTFLRAQFFTDYSQFIQIISDQICDEEPVQEACEDEKVDLVFVLDSSGSISDKNPPDGSYDNWNILLTFVTRVVQTLDIGLNASRVGIVKYSEVAESVFYLDTYNDKEFLIQRILQIVHVQSFTNTSGGLREMHFNQFTEEHGDRPEVPNIAIVITDGVSTVDANRTIDDAISARNDGIRILVFGITFNVSEEELRNISSEPQLRDETYFIAGAFERYRDYIQIISNSICIPENGGSNAGTSTTLQTGQDITPRTTQDPRVSPSSSSNGGGQGQGQSTTLSQQSTGSQGQTATGGGQQVTVSQGQSGSSTVTPYSGAVTGRTTPTSTSRVYTSQINLIHPSFGPTEGGTLVSIYGISLGDVREVTFKRECDGDEVCTTDEFAVIDFLQHTNDKILMYTSPLQVPIASGRPKYSVWYKNATMSDVDSGQRFEYRPLPVIEDVFPRVSFLAGGTGLTVTGRHFDSVHNPTMIIYAEIRRPSDSPDTSVIERHPFLMEDMVVVDASTMITRTPNFEEDQSLIEFINNDLSNRRKREINEEGRVNSNEVQFYITFDLDVDDYRDTEWNEELRTLLVYINPTFEQFEGTYSYNRDEKRLIQIKGERLTQGAIQSDYRISFGNKECEVRDLLDNVIYCEPPEKEPGIIKSGGYKDGEPRMHVHVGNYDAIIGHVDYVKNYTILIVIVCTMAALLLIAIVATACWYTRKNKQPMEKRRPFQSESESYEADHNNIEANNNVDDAVFPQIRT